MLKDKEKSVKNIFEEISENIQTNLNQLQLTNPNIENEKDENVCGKVYFDIEGCNDIVVDDIESFHNDKEDYNINSNNTNNSVEENFVSQTNNVLNNYKKIPFIIANKESHIVKIMLLRQDVLNKKIGTNAYKKYLSAIIWNYVTTFINFSITLLTALSTGQAASSNILNKQQSVIILFVTFVLTTTNSFFKLNIKMNLNFESAKTYYKFGCDFEKIYYKSVNNRSDILEKLYEYQLLHDAINEYILTETIEHQNYLSELIYYVLVSNSFAVKLNSEKYTKWISYTERHQELDGMTPNEFLNLKEKLVNAFSPLKFRNSRRI